jgi:hypothetical protein
MSEQVPSVGRAVHYVSYGTPGGEYTSQCRAAIITAVHGRATGPEIPGDSTAWSASLAVLNPEGMFFNQGCHQSEADHRGDTWHWPERV